MSASIHNEDRITNLIWAAWTTRFLHISTKVQKVRLCTGHHILDAADQLWPGVEIMVAPRLRCTEHYDRSTLNIQE